MDTARPTARRGMETALRRRFRLLDAMILMAATALGCGLEQLISHATDGDVSWQTLYEEGPAHLYRGGWDAKTIYLQWPDSWLESRRLLAKTQPGPASWDFAPKGPNKYRGRENRLVPPPSEPCRRISRTRLSSRWSYLGED